MNIISCSITTFKSTGVTVDSRDSMFVSQSIKFIAYDIKLVAYGIRLVAMETLLIVIAMKIAFKEW